MPNDLWNKLVSELAELHVRASHFAFGLFNEPTLDPQLLPRINQLIAALPHQKIAINTSGKIMLTALARELNSQLHNIAFTFCGYDAASYERNTIGGHFDRIRENILSLVNLPGRRFDVRVSVVTTRETVGKLEAVRQLFPRACVGYSLLMNRCAALSNFADIVPGEPRPSWCNVTPMEDLIIDSDGIVLLCCQDWMREVPLGNLRKESIAEIRYRHQNSKLRRLLETGQRDQIVSCTKCMHADESWRDGRGL